MHKLIGILFLFVLFSTAYIYHDSKKTIADELNNEITEFSTHIKDRLERELTRLETIIYNTSDVDKVYAALNTPYITQFIFSDTSTNVYNTRPHISILKGLYLNQNPALYPVITQENPPNVSQVIINQNSESEFQIKLMNQHSIIIIKYSFTLFINEFLPYLTKKTNSVQLLGTSNNILFEYFIASDAPTEHISSTFSFQNLKFTIQFMRLHSPSETFVLIGIFLSFFLLILYITTFWYSKVLNEKELMIKEHKAMLNSYISNMDSINHSISHNLKAPLRQILSYISIFETTSHEEKEKQQRFIQFIKGSASHLHKQLLVLSETSMISHLSLQPEQIQFTHALYRVKDQFKQLDIHIEMPSEHNEFTLITIKDFFLRFWRALFLILEEHKNVKITLSIEEKETELFCSVKTEHLKKNNMRHEFKHIGTTADNFTLNSIENYMSLLNYSAKKIKGTIQYMISSSVDDDYILIILPKVLNS